MTTYNINRQHTKDLRVFFTKKCGGSALTFKGKPLSNRQSNYLKNASILTISAIFPELRHFCSPKAYLPALQLSWFRGDMLMQILSSHKLQHALHTSITTIFGMVGFLKNEPLSLIQQDCVDGILRSAKQLLDFANTLQSQSHNDIPLISSKKSKVLLVEDHPLIRVIHQTMLLDLNFQPDVVSNAKEALALANNNYDLIVLDIGLPDICGIELAKILKKMPHHSNTPILALAVYTDFNTQQSCLAAGITEVLHKPIDHSTLAAALYSYQSTKEGLCS